MLAVGVGACDGGCATGGTPGAAGGTAGTRDAAVAGASASADAKTSPGAPTPSVTPALRKELDAALSAKGPNYVPRTKHLESSGAPKYTNRLVRESSPYLLQHAHNPVNWFPWGAEAFELAEQLNRPVFLSVGYSTCHWCHVMEEESFEDEEIAAFINDNYIPVKVDREERPDVDSIYMTAIHLMGGRGGWPMSVWLTPERKPYFGGTYFPARDGDRGARKGFITILGEQRDRFQNAPTGVASESNRLADGIRAQKEGDSGGGTISPRVFDLAAQYAKRSYDPEWGGRQGRPKFPSSFPVRGMLRNYRNTGDTESRDMALATLTKMSQGGMYDHVAGGFHRYSTDSQWLVPHFEKMLYDNALLTLAYLDAYQVSGDPDVARVAREILDYVAREMTSPEGAFYSATDADSIGPAGHREEGYYFTWTPAELDDLLGKADSEQIQRYYAVTASGNFEGRNILHTPDTRAEAAKKLGITKKALDALIARARPKLLAARNSRPPPLRDDKVQASWNGLMVSAFARGARVLADARYETIAEAAATTLLSRLRKNGRLHHSFTGDGLSSVAFADDYTFLAAGLLDLFELTNDPRWLKDAIALMEDLEKYHADAEGGGYYLTPSDGEKLLAREKPAHDGAIPSANSLAVANHARLSELTTDDRWRQRGETTLRAFSDTLQRRPMALDIMLLGADFFLGTPKEIVIVTPEGQRGAAEPLLAVLNRTYLPNHVLVVGTEQDFSGELGNLVPWAKEKPAKNGQATAYVCERGACELPTTHAAVFQKQLAPTRIRQESTSK